MAEGPHSVRPVDDGDQQGIACFMPVCADFLTLVVIHRFLSGEPGFIDRPVVVVPPQHRIALIEQAGDRVHHAGGVGTVDHLKARKAAFVRRDVDKAAGGNKSGEHGAVEQDVRVVHAVDLVQVEVVVAKLPNSKPVCQTVHSLGTPSDSGVPGTRCGYAEIPDAVLHLVVLIALQHPLAF